jgi:hypothetical protein
MPENFACDIIMPLAQNQFKLVDFCAGWFAGIGNCVVDRFVPIMESSGQEPNRKFEI